MENTTLYKYQPLIIAGAIIVAGILIGVAVVIGSSMNDSESQNSASKQQQKQQKGVTIQEAVNEIGMTPEKIMSCVENRTYEEEVSSEKQNGKESGLRGTPHTVAIGPNGRAISVSGAQPKQVWEQIIDVLASGKELPDNAEQVENVNSVTDGDLVRGTSDAPVTLVEYSDLDCPFCTRLHDTLTTLLSERDDFNWVYRHAPMPQLHPNAFKKALAVECVYNMSNQNNAKTWRLIDAFFTTKR